MKAEDLIADVVICLIVCLMLIVAFTNTGCSKTLRQPPPAQAAAVLASKVHGDVTMIQRDAVEIKEAVGRGKILAPAVPEWQVIDFAAERIDIAAGCVGRDTIDLAVVAEKQTETIEAQDVANKRLKSSAIRKFSAWWRWLAISAGGLAIFWGGLAIWLRSKTFAIIAGSAVLTSTVALALAEYSALIAFVGAGILIVLLLIAVAFLAMTVYNHRGVILDITDTSTENTPTTVATIAKLKPTPKPEK